MRTYDYLPDVIAPYMTFMSRPDYKSPVVNTDRHGFRVSARQGSTVDTVSWWRAERRGIVLGGSFVFGVGATQDAATLVSALNGEAPYTFVNLGVRAANSTQELIACLPFVEAAHCVLVCSGMNNLLVNLQSLGYYELFGPLFGEEHCRELARYSIAEVRDLTEGRLGRVPFRMLLGEVRARVARRLGRVRPSAAASTPASPPDPARAVERALELQRRDLRIVTRAVAPGATVIFAAQAFAPTARKKLSDEETALFGITDGLQGAHWQVMKGRLAELWPRYVTGLRALCPREGVRFVDLNATPLDGWCFVDRVHMTDTGYAQVAAALAREVA
jgi:hypothetical protein